MKLSTETQFSTGNFIDNFYYFNATGLPGSVKTLSDEQDIEQFGERLLGELDVVGVIIDTINIYFGDSDEGKDLSISSPDGIYSDARYFDFENLRRLGLLEKVEVKQFSIGIFVVDIHYYLVTPVGADLYACCNPGRLRREQ